MDNLTHTLLGATLSRAGLNRLAPQAGWLMVAAANIPDADVVSGLHGAVCYLDYHRGWTHSVPWSPVVALGPLLIWWLLVRRSRPGPRQWLGAYTASFLGVASHFLLDWLNVYGIRLLLPFRADWFRLDLLNIIDIWVWIILGLGVLGPFLARLVNAEIGARSGPGRAGAWMVLVLLGLYIFARSETHARAVAILESRLYNGETPRRTAATPGPVNPLRWRGLVETSDAWRIVDVDLLREFDPESGQVFYKPEPSVAIDAARKTETARVFLGFASFPVWRIVPIPDPEGGVSVRVGDIRFGDPGEGRFEAAFLLDAGRRVVRQGFEFGTLRSGPP